MEKKSLQMVANLCTLCCLLLFTTVYSKSFYKNYFDYFCLNILMRKIRECHCINFHYGLSSNFKKWFRFYIYLLCSCLFFIFVMLLQKTSQNSAISCIKIGLINNLPS